MGAEFEKQVSVIMGVYNQWNREALQKAVKSILNLPPPDQNRHRK